MPVTNQEAITFCDQRLRPLAEALRDLQAVASDAKGVWDGGVGTIITDPGGDIADGREDEGVSRLTSVDCANFMAQVDTLLTQFGGAGVMDVIRKPCVRPLSVMHSPNRLA